MKTYDRILQDIIISIEEFGTSEKIDHRFVGGLSYGGLLNDKTKCQINISRRQIRLMNHNPLSLLRPDGTPRDIDVIFLTVDKKKVAKLKKFVAQLKWRIRRKIHFTPPISIEGPLAHKARSPQGFLRFVTVIEYGKTDSGIQYFLRFDKIRQKISKESLEAWKVVLKDGTSYTTRNPIADYYAYQFRSPSGIKPKDQEKVKHLKHLTNHIVKEGRKHNINYFSLEHFAQWDTFTNTLKKSRIPSVTSKKMITKWYWSTIGTDLAHGKGFLRKTILAFFNLVTRLRQ